MVEIFTYKNNTNIYFLVGHVGLEPTTLAL